MAARFIVKERNRHHYLQMDKNQEWYSVHLEHFSSTLKSSFRQLSFDQETSNFVEASYETSNFVLLQMFYNVALVVLKLFWERTCVNALLNRGRMFLFSEHNFDTLFDFKQNKNYCAIDNNMCNNSNALDLGAGDGSISRSYAKHFSSIYATEASAIMRRRLRDKYVLCCP